MLPTPPDQSLLAPAGAPEVFADFPAGIHGFPNIVKIQIDLENFRAWPECYVYILGGKASEKHKI